MRFTVFNTPIISQLLYCLAWLTLKLLGWKVEGEPPKSARYVLIGAPHTSNWDFALTISASMILRMRINWLGKVSLFYGPLRPIMRWMGGIPVNRERRTGIVSQAVNAFRTNRRLIIALSPEGTRSQVSRWKTGFYHIAREANVPIVLGYLDFGRKVVGIGPSFRPTGDLERDMAAIQHFYQDIQGKHPEKFCENCINEEGEMQALTR
ncbi:lysophospholipid acyltransferase family protein [Endozoicomonadaceae bacterium StTr2]